MRVATILLLCSFFSFGLFGQVYFNKLLETSENSILFEKIHQLENGTFVVPFDYAGEEHTEAGLFITDFDSTREVKFSNLNLGPVPIVEHEDNFYLIGKNSSEASQNMSCMQLDGQLNDSIWYTSSPTLGVSSINNSAAAIEDIYILNITSLDNLYKILELLRVNELGDVVWSKALNNDGVFRTTSWDMLPSNDLNLLISNIVSYPSQGIGGYNQLMKISPEGDVIWRDTGVEKVDGGSPAWMTELTNGTIVVSYRLRRPDYIFLGLEPLSTRLKWYNQDGDSLFQKEILYPVEISYSILQIKAGQGDYFYSYGQIVDDASQYTYGYLTKFTNSGDSIWQKKYRTDEVLGSSRRHLIKDIIELDNGDLIVLGEVRELGEKTKIWIFKIDENGCFGSDNCGETIITSTKSPTLLGGQPINPIKITPNPSSGFFHVESVEPMKWYRIFDMQGKLITEIIPDDREVQVDLGDKPKGMYLLQFRDRNGAIFWDKLMKL